MCVLTEGEGHRFQHSHIAFDRQCKVVAMNLTVTLQAAQWQVKVCNTTTVIVIVIQLLYCNTTTVI